MKNFINRALVAKKHLKLFFALFAMLALGVGNAWGAEVTFDATKDKGSSSTGAVSYEKEGITLSVENGALGNGTDYRVYKNTKLTITSSVGDITNIALTYKSDSYDGGGWVTSYQPNADSWTSPTASGEQARITKIVVTYTPSGGGETPEPDPTPDPGTGGEALSYTWDLSTNSYSAASTNQVTWSAADVNMVIDKASAQTNANNYLPTAKTSTRFYTNSKLTITPAANVTITSVVFTATSTGYASALQGSTWTNASASVSGTTVTVTPTNGASAISATIGGTCGFTGVTVHYTKAASGEPEPVIVKTLNSITVTGMKTTYEQGDIFKFNGTCTATYSVTKDGVPQADETAEVTPTSVSTPNMNTIGTQTVTVTYSEGGVEKTAEYQITITENTVTAGEYCITPNNEFWGTNFNGTISGDALNQVYTGRQDDITVQYSKGSGSNLYINNTQTRTYNGTALTIFASNGYVITAIAFTADGSNWAGTHTACRYNDRFKELGRFCK